MLGGAAKKKRGLQQNPQWKTIAIKAGKKRFDPEKKGGKGVLFVWEKKKKKKKPKTPPRTQVRRTEKTEQIVQGESKISEEEKKMSSFMAGAGEKSTRRPA